LALAPFFNNTGRGVWAPAQGRGDEEFRRDAKNKNGAPWGRAVSIQRNDTNLTGRGPWCAVAGVALEEQRLAGDRGNHRGLERL
jgi:hypothetical protein